MSRPSTPSSIRRPIPCLRGEIVIQEYICNSCHTLDSLGWTAAPVLRLNGIADRAGERVPGNRPKSTSPLGLERAGFRRAGL